MVPDDASQEHNPYILLQGETLSVGQQPYFEFPMPTDFGNSSL